MQKKTPLGVNLKGVVMVGVGLSRPRSSDAVLLDVATVGEHIAHPFRLAASTAAPC